MKPIRRTKKSKVNLKKDRFRLSVFRSNANIYAQIINDGTGETLASASSLKLATSGNKVAAEEVGKAIAEAAKKQKIKALVFDRGNRIYHGRVAALADAARKNGLTF